MADYQAEYQSYTNTEADYSANGAGGDYQGDSGVKRSFDQSQGSDTYSPAKRSKNQEEDVELRCLVPSRTAGGIIGRSGSVIKQMRNEYKAQIHVHDNESPERVMQVTASIESCGKIVEQILPVINEGSTFQRKDGTTSFSIKMLVHQSQAGGIIGLKGYTIKELRERTGAIIKVDQDCCPGSTDRVCIVSGSIEVISSCVVKILELLTTIPPKGPVQNFDPGFCNDMFGQDEGFGFGQFGDRGFRGGFRGRGGGGGGGGNFRGRGFGGGGRGNFNRGGGGGFNQGPMGGGGGYNQGGGSGFDQSSSGGFNQGGGPGFNQGGGTGFNQGGGPGFNQGGGTGFNQGGGTGFNQGGGTGFNQGGGTGFNRGGGFNRGRGGPRGSGGFNRGPRGGSRGRGGRGGRGQSNF